MLPTTIGPQLSQTVGHEIVKIGGEW